MKVTIKAAAELSRNLLELVKNTKIQIFDSVDHERKIPAAIEVIKANEAVNLLKIQRVSKAFEAAYGIRVAIGEMNDKLGINTMLAEIAAMDAEIQYLEKTLSDMNDSATPSDDTDLIKNKITNIQNSKEPYYGSVRVKYVTVIDALTQKLVSLKRERSDRKGEVAAKNILNHITLTSDVIAILKENNLVK